MSHSRRQGWAGGAGVAAVLLWSAAADAQDTTTIPAPGIERYSLPPGPGQATPTPTPTPTPTSATPAPTLTPAPPPSVIPTLQIPRATPTPSSAPGSTATATPARTPATRAAPAPAATAPAAQAAPVTVPVPDAPQAGETLPSDTPAPVPAATPAPPAAAVTPSGGAPGWLWWALGLAALAAVGVALWLRTRRDDDATEEWQPVEDIPPPVPAPDPSPRPVTTPAAQADRVLALDFRPQRLWTRGPDAHLAFELVVTNTGAAPLDAVRPVIVLASAGPDTAAEIAAFQANASTIPGGEPFALAAGASNAISGELTLPGNAMYVTTAADRELIVPVALIALSWRAGVSVARTSDAFVIGTGEATSPRLGPIWVDRAGQVYPRLDARRFTPGGARGGA